MTLCFGAVMVTSFWAGQRCFCLRWWGIAAYQALSIRFILAQPLTPALSGNIHQRMGVLKCNILLEWVTTKPYVKLPSSGWEPNVGWVMALGCHTRPFALGCGTRLWLIGIPQAQKRRGRAYLPFLSFPDKQLNLIGSKTCVNMFSISTKIWTEIAPFSAQ